MIEVVYRREVSYPQPAVLSQYFDLEHVEHVHPRSFGRARMVSTNHNIIAWELEWPPVLGLIRLQSTFAQEYRPPWGIHATITRGFLRGTEISVEINKTDAGTLVVEHYRIPLPAWLRGWIQRALVRSLDRVWEEDLAVKLPRGGWPGVPGVDNRNLPEHLA